MIGKNIELVDVRRSVLILDKSVDINRIYLKRDMEKILISIVIRTYFRENTLVKTLKSIANSNYPRNKIEIIVVRDLKDQGAANVVDIFKQRYPEVSILLLTMSVNSATQAWNLGIKHSKGKIVGVTADDVLIHPDSIRRAVSILKEDCKVAAVTFPTIFETQSIDAKVHHMKLIGTLTDNVSTALLLTFYRKKILEKVGMYREDMGLPFTIHEDWELGSRLRKHGYKIIVDGMIVQRHLGIPRKNISKTDFDNSLHNRIRNDLKQGIKRLRRYATSYFNRNYRTFFEVMKSSPLSQQVEYSFYFLMPLIGLGLLQKPIYAFAYLLLLVFFLDAHSFFNGYYKVFGLRGRLVYPIFLLSARVLKTYLSVLGYLINIVTGVLK